MAEVFRQPDYGPTHSLAKTGYWLSGILFLAAAVPLALDIASAEFNLLPEEIDTAVSVTKLSLVVFMVALALALVTRTEKS